MSGLCEEILTENCHVKGMPIVWVGEKVTIFSLGRKRNGIYVSVQNRRGKTHSLLEIDELQLAKTSLGFQSHVGSLTEN